jgi:hypothetical protein
MSDAIAGGSNRFAAGMSDHIFEGDSDAPVCNNPTCFRRNSGSEER